MQEETANPSALGVGAKLFYGSGQAVDAVIQAVVNTFLLFYLTTVCGLSGALAGSIFLISLVIDALLDPMIGRLSDTARTSWGRRLPFMAGALLPMVASSWLLFNLPSVGGTPFVYAAALGLNITLRVSLSFFALPHSALLAEFTGDYAERAVLGTYRALFIVVGTAAALAPALGYVFVGPSAMKSASAYQSLGFLTAALIALFGSACVFGIYRRARSLPLPTDHAGEHASNLIRDVFDLFGNRSFVLMFAGAVLVLVGQGATAALNLHAFRYFWKLLAALMQLPLLMLPAGMLIGTAAAAIFLKRVEKRDGVLGAVFVLAVYQIGITMAVWAGIVHAGSMLSVGLVAGNGFLLGAGGAICFVCFYSMIADAVDEHDLLFGIRREALFAAALMIGSKAATGVGGFLAGLGLQFIGFDASARDGQVSETLAGELGLLWGVVPAAILFVALPLFRIYGISRERHAEISHSLSMRGSL